MDQAKIGARIKKARVDANLRQRDVEEKTGISQGTLSKIETGQQSLSLEHALALAKVCKIDLSKLVAGAA